MPEPTFVYRISTVSDFAPRRFRQRRQPTTKVGGKDAPNLRRQVVWMRCCSAVGSVDHAFARRVAGTPARNSPDVAQQFNAQTLFAFTGSRQQFKRLSASVWPFSCRSLSDCE